jgi:hypothetical protein
LRALSKEEVFEVKVVKDRLQQSPFDQFLLVWDVQFPWGATGDALAGLVAR